MSEDRKTYYGIDDHERIDLCLACEKPKCNNCLERVPHPEGRRKKRAFRPRRKEVDNASVHDTRQTDHKEKPFADRGE